MSQQTQNLKSVPPTAQTCVLKYGDCNNRVAHSAMEKLDNFTGWTDTQAMWRFNKIKAVFDRTSKTVRRDFNKLISKHAVHQDVTTLGTDGKTRVPVLDKSGRPKRQPKTIPKGNTMDFLFHDQKAFDKDYADLMNTEFTVKAYQLPLDDLIKAGLTPKELRSVARLADNIDPELIEEPEVRDDDNLDDDELDDNSVPEAVDSANDLVK